ncbi:hypothetical protein PWT90_09657 [Aphanocladium album]|nr:hypothetical protein PWT90_09657 [Aphanocladium album]
MAPTGIPSPEKITKAEFAALLDEYPSLVDAISKSKASKPGQKSLRQLDEYRYGTALADFSASCGGGGKAMTLDDVKLLVEWKLRHGKFRPTLMSLASSNDAAAAARAIAAAVATYRGDPSDAGIAAALAGLTKLRGIGPATASLLLTVHDPARVLFFSDEAFYWLCGGGKVTAIKYNNKEYELLRQNAAKLVKRLGVSATDVEKVAYVLFKRDAAGADEKSKTAPKVKAAGKAVKDDKGAKEAPAKRKSAVVKEEEPEPTPGTRRSKRVKK